MLVGDKMDELELQKIRLKKKHEHSIQKHKPTMQNKEDNKLAKMFTRVLIAIIFVLASAIYINWSKDNLEMYRKTVFESTLSFTSINEWYEKYFGSVLPIDINTPSIPVNKTTTEPENIEKYENGVSCKTQKGSTITALNSGILVFLGEKENYGNVAIVQGIDGVDIWYGNIENVNFSLYDYVEKNALLGSAKEEKIYYVVQKDGQFLDYEEYKKQI